MHSETRAPLPSHILRLHSAQINDLSFSADNERLYSADAGGRAAITSTRGLRPLAAWQAHKAGILGIQEWGDKVITHGRDNKLHVWRVQLAHHSNTLGDSAAVPSSSEPSLCYSMDVNALNFCRFSMLPFLGASQSSGSSCLIALPNLVESSLIDIWSLPTRHRLHAAIGKENGEASDVSWKNDGRGENKTGILMSLHLFSEPRTLADDSTLHVLAAYENGGVTLWRYASMNQEPSIEGRGWQSVWTVKLHAESVMAMATTNDNNLAITVSADHLIGRYDLLGARESAGRDAQNSMVHRTKHPGNSAVRFRDDGRVCAIAGWDGRIRLYSSKSMKSLGTLSYHTKACNAVAFAHDLPGESNLTDLPGPLYENHDDDADDDMTADEKLARSRWLAAGSQDCRISIWELKDFKRS